MGGAAWQGVQEELRREPRQWLVSGAAGFIGSHLVQTLLELGQEVRGLDDFSTGSRKNLEELERCVGPAAAARFDFTEGDLGDRALCQELCASGPLVLHQAAHGSVPRSILNPEVCFQNNVRGFFHLLEAARAGGSPAFVYASSSSVYGDLVEQPRREAVLGQPLSPYAASKRLDEILATTAQRCYGQPTIGLRYFNVFGPRQDPSGPYAAVIARWCQALLAGEPVEIHGDGATSRDFCPVSCVVQANLLAALAGPAHQGQLFNVGLGQSTTLLQLFEHLRRLARAPTDLRPRHGAPRAGDVLHSQADLSSIQAALGYVPGEDLPAALGRTLEWFRLQLAPN